MAIGFLKSEAVEKGPFINALLAFDGAGYDAAAYVATDDDGNPVSLSVRVILSSDVDISKMQAAGIPIRGRKSWDWGGGQTQPVGRKGSR